MWRCNTNQLYVMEILEPAVKLTRNVTQEVNFNKHLAQLPNFVDKW